MLTKDHAEKTQYQILMCARKLTNGQFNLAYSTKIKPKGTQQPPFYGHYTGQPALASTLVNN